MNNMFDRINKLILEKSEKSMLSQFCRAFLEKNPIITDELFPCIEKLIGRNDYQSKILGLYTKQYEIEKQQILEKIRERFPDTKAMAFYFLSLEYINKRLEINTFASMMEYIERDLVENSGLLVIFCDSYKDIHGSEDPDYISTNYKYYYIGSLLYDEFTSIKSRTDILRHKCASDVCDEYRKASLDLPKIDMQFSKYKLLSKNDFVTIHNNKDSQTIVDSRIGKHFLIDIPRKLLHSIEELIENKNIKDISFRISGILKYIPIMEEMEFGSKLELKISELPKLSKFYSTECYGNNLWVTHDQTKRSLTFEELVDNFEIFDESIVTQVVHLEYKIENDKFFISHLDHEFIVYTLEEYSNRESNPEVKGHKRIKTFKIDNSKIPFTYKVNGEFFLYQVLDSYLKNKDLVSEYFENIINQEARLI